MLIEGQYFAAGSAQAVPATLERQGTQLQMTHANGSSAFPTGQVQISARLAQLPRRLEFPNGDSFTTPDNDGVDALFDDAESLRGTSFINRLERSWPWALAALAALPVCLWLLFTHGLPIVAQPLAHAIPERLTDQLDDAVLDLLDDELLAPSTLPEPRQAEITQLLEDLQPTQPVELLFRTGGVLDANALALPGGTIIITDELVQLTVFDGELSAVLAHELAHVEERHAMQALIQTVGAATVLGWVFGDLTLVTDLALVSTPAILQQLSYTRGFEEEADRLATQMLKERGIPGHCMASLMTRFREHYGDDPTSLPS
ncbi:MAG: M48 family metallopeptidase, partial [Pseudomonadota bacterium]